MILPIVHELSLYSITDRGVPNRERIILRPAEMVNLLQFIVVLAVRAENGMVRPLIDHVFWFPELLVSPPGWVVIYTGPGVPRQSVVPATGQPVYNFHWGKRNTVFNDPNVVAAVLGLRSILVPPLEAAAPGPPPNPRS